MPLPKKNPQFGWVPLQFFVNKTATIKQHSDFGCGINEINAITIPKPPLPFLGGKHRSQFYSHGPVSETLGMVLLNIGLFFSSDWSARSYN
jgi:hypothetical protein